MSEPLEPAAPFTPPFCPNPSCTFHLDPAGPQPLRLPHHHRAPLRPPRPPRPALPRTASTRRGAGRTPRLRRLRDLRTQPVLARAPEHGGRGRQPQAIERTTQEALSLAVPSSHLEVTLLADEHKAYPRALRGLLGRRFRLEQTSSRRPRVPGNPLQPVNHLHALMRHSGANFKRETLAWSKRRQSMVWRDCLFRVWRNWVKRTAERGSGGEDQPRGSLCQVSGTIPGEVHSSAPIDGSIDEADLPVDVLRGDQRGRVVDDGPELRLDLPQRALRPFVERGALRRLADGLRRCSSLQWPRNSRPSVRATPRTPPLRDAAHRGPFEGEFRCDPNACHARGTGRRVDAIVVVHFL